MWEKQLEMLKPDERTQHAARQIELFKTLNRKLTQHLCWSVICIAPVKNYTHKTLVVCFIALLMSTPDNLIIRLSKTWCTSLRIKLRNFSVNKTTNIPQRCFILTLCIVIFPILLSEILRALTMEWTPKNFCCFCFILTNN